jgi:hypothetical protein
MWTINSNDVEQAKDRLQRRRAQIETRYADEKKGLDAEFAVIETLERAASEFAVSCIQEDPDDAAASLVGSDPPVVGETLDGAENVETAPTPAPEAEPSGSDEASGAFDILKPGSRWRLTRGNRLSNAEGATDGPSPASW